MGGWGNGLKTENKEYKEMRVRIYLVDKDNNAKIRLTRQSAWLRGTLRMMHYRVLNFEDAIPYLEAVFAEFGVILENPDQKKGLEEYREKLKKKPFNKLGVNIDG